MQTWIIEFNQIPSQKVTVEAADIGQAVSKALDVWRIINPPTVSNFYERL